MVPKTPRNREELRDVKEEIRREVMEGRFVVEAFGAKAKVKSTCETGAMGGLLGELLPQGAVRDRTLDRACFTVPLGVVIGPLETDEGYHLLLVQERKGCKNDQGLTRIVKRSRPDGSHTSELVGDMETFPVADLFVGGAITGGVLVAGGVLAEIASQPVPPPEVFFY